MISIFYPIAFLLNNQIRYILYPENTMYNKPEFIALVGEINGSPSKQHLFLIHISSMDRHF